MTASNTANHTIAIDDNYLTLKDADGETCDARNFRNLKEAKQIVGIWSRDFPVDAEQAKRELQTFEKLEGLFTSIARRHLFIETLETRKSDSLDFHEVGVGGVRKALMEAYLAGRGQATA